MTNPAGAGEFRVFNQFTEQFTVLELAAARAARRPTSWASRPRSQHYPNPRVEAEEHYYRAVNTSCSPSGSSPHSSARS